MSVGTRSETHAEIMDHGWITTDREVMKEFFGL